MKILEPSAEIAGVLDGVASLKNIELAGRVCYKSEGLVTEDSYISFVRGLILRGHESVLEHEKATVKVVCDRGVSHEIVRHRIASYSQESSRYCTYSGDKYGNEISVIRPCFWTEGSTSYQLWFEAAKSAEVTYMELLAEGASAQEARTVLPNCLKTEIYITMNFREWRHFFSLRTSKAAHPQMRQVAFMILELLRERVPVVFEEFVVHEDISEERKQNEAFPY